MEFTKSQKLFIALFFIGLIIWIGGSIVRTTIAYDIFETGENTLKFKFWVDEKIALLTVRHFAIGSLYTSFGFLLAITSFLIISSKLVKYFKSNGWLLMSFILFSISAIFELINIYFDVRLGSYIFFESNLSYFSKEVQTFFYNRLTKYNFSTIYNWLAAFTIIVFMVYKPLKK